MSNKENKITPLYKETLNLKKELHHTKVSRKYRIVAGFFFGFSVGLLTSLLISWLCGN